MSLNTWSAAAETVQEPTARPSFRTLLPIPGDSSLKIYAIVEDGLGFIWVGTRDGLFRYDGKTFEAFVHDPDDPSTIRQNWVWNLTTDTDGRVWIATWGGGVSRYDPRTEQLVHFTHDPDDPASLSNNNIWTVFVQKDGTTWVATENGLNRFRGDIEGFVRLPSQSVDPQGLSGESISSVAEDSSGRLWIGIYGVGVDVLGTDGAVTNRHTKIKNVWDLETDRYNSIWAATETGLWQLLDGGSEFELFEPDDGSGDKFTQQFLTDLKTDDDGTLWISTWGNGIYRLNAERTNLQNFLADPRSSDKIANNTVYRVHIDRDGNLWALTDSGISKADPLEHRFATTRYLPGAETGLPVPGVNALFFDEQDRLWIGTDGGGLGVRSRGEEAVRVYDTESGSGLVDASVTSILPARNGAVWLGTRGGLQVFNPIDENFTSFPAVPGSDKGPIGDNIAAMALDQEGDLWIACYGAGASRWNRRTGKFSHFTHDAKPPDTSGLATDWVTSIEVGASGKVWIGGDGGLTRINPADGQVELAINSLNDQTGLNVVSLFEDNTGTLWIGTDTGLYARSAETGEIRPVTDASGLSGQRIQAITSDEQGHVWISTNKGLSRISPQSGIFWNFSVEDGLQSTSFLPGAVWRAKDGDIYFGGSQGFNRFHPDDLEVNQRPVPVVFTELRIEGRLVVPGQTPLLDRSLSVTPAVVLPHDQSSVAVSFAGLNMSLSEKTRFRYKMEGLDQTWLETEQTDTASYANLAPGSYTLKVTAANHDGVWNKTPAELLISVTVPWWNTPYAYAAYAVLLLGALYGSSRVGGKLQSLRADRLEALVSARTLELEKEMKARHLAEADLLQARMENATRISQKLEAVGRLAGGVAHDFNNLLGIIVGNLDFLKSSVTEDEKVQKRITTAKRAARRGSEMTQKLLGFASREVGNVEAIDPGTVIRDMDIVLKQALTASIQLELDLPEQSNPVRIDRGEFEDALLNLAINARDATPENGHFRIGLRSVELADTSDQEQSAASFAEVTVSDTGTGMSEETRARVFEPFYTTKPVGSGTGLGLSTVYGFVSRSGGNISVESQIGDGTTFTLHLPEIDPASIETPTASQDPETGSGAVSILVVEDEPDLLDLVQDWLRADGFIVETASSGDAALKALEERPQGFSLVFTDLQMPGTLSGIRLAEIIEKDYPETSILITTGYSNLKNLDKGLLSPHWTVIRKPYDRQALVQQITKLLQL